MRREIKDINLTNIRDDELMRVLGILQCERMLYSRSPENEFRIDWLIVSIKAEIQRRYALR